MSQLTIRDARAEERAAIAALTHAAYAEYATTMAPGAWRGLNAAVHAALASDDPAEWIVAEQDGALVGSVGLFAPVALMYEGAVVGADAPELRMLAVAPDARGQGVGEALVAECIARARRSGASALGLHTSDSMRAAMRMYERFGCVRAPEHDFQAEETELVKGYRLELGS